MLKIQIYVHLEGQEKLSLQKLVLLTQTAYIRGSQPDPL
jgi:hypothetical protein